MAQGPGLCYTVVNYTPSNELGNAEADTSFVVKESSDIITFFF